MILRRDDRGVIAIAQSSHAWISGQLARAWGNRRFGVVEPYEEVCLAAEQHDAGMADWDRAPKRNPVGGLPYSFVEMPLRDHLAVWSDGPRRVLTQSRYASLLVSMHGWRLYSKRNLSHLGGADADAVRGYMDAERSFQRLLLEELRGDARLGPWCGEEVIARNSQLVWVWDYLSLALCLDWAPCELPELETEEGGVRISVSSVPGARFTSLDPWPLRERAVTVRCDGRRLRDGATSDRQLRHALACAPLETVEFELRAPAPADHGRGSADQSAVAQTDLRHAS